MRPLKSPISQRLMAFFFLFAFSSTAWCETVRVLQLRGEGTAIVYVSDTTGKALITDGGKRGDAGIASAQIDGTGVLRWLLDKHNVKFLVLECSHPDSDHLDALVQMVTFDEALREFDEVHFVDSGFRKHTANGSKSLYEHYLDGIGKSGKQPRVVMPHSAENANAFKSLFSERDEIQVRNFKYEPTEDAPVHGHTIITETTIRHGNEDGTFDVLQMVDPDDADTKLVKRWGDERAAERQPLDLFIVPHHGSDRTDISPILALKPKACVFTVNPNNQYGHPSPRNLWKCIEALEVQNVHITANEGDVVFGSKLPEPVRDPKILAGAFARAVRPSMMRCERDLAAYEELALAGTLTPEQKSKVEALIADYDAYLKIQKAMTDRAGTRRRWTVAFGANQQDAPPSPPADDGPETFGPSKKPPGGGGGSDNTGDFRKKIAELNELLKSDSAKDEPSTPPKLRFERAIEKKPVFGGIALGNEIHSAPKVTTAEIRLVSNRLVIVVTTDDGKGTFEEMTNTELLTAYSFVMPDEEIRRKFGLAEDEPSLLSSQGPSKNGTYSGAIHPAIANTIIARDGLQLDGLIFAVVQHGVPGDSGLAGLREVSLPAQWYDESADIALHDNLITVQATTEPKNCLLRLRSWNNRHTPEWLNGAKDRELRIFEEKEARGNVLAKKMGLELSAEYALSRSHRRIAWELSRELRDSPAWLPKNADADAFAAALENEAEKRLTAAMNREHLTDSVAYKLNEILRESTRAGDSIPDEKQANERIVATFEQKTKAVGLWNEPDAKFLFEILRGAFPTPAAIEKIATTQPDLAQAGFYLMFRFQTQFADVERTVDHELVGNSFAPPQCLSVLADRFEPFQRLDRFARTVAVLRWLKSEGKLPKLPDGVTVTNIDVPPSFTQKQVDDLLKLLTDGS